MTTTKLTDLQLILLATAVQREDGSILPPPERLGDQGARIRKAIPPLLKRGLVEEISVTDPTRSWREDGEQRIGLAITAAGRAIIADEETDDADASSSAANAEGAASKMLPEPAKPITKIATVIELLRREDGATLAELVAITGWLPHTTRAALTGLRKRGHAIDKRARGHAICYVIATAA